MPTENQESGVRSRNRVLELLRRGCDLKLQRSSTKDAEAAIGEAYRLCRSSPEWRDPWLWITAYRLAHLKMRAAKDSQSLETIDHLFLEASQWNYLKPVASIYRLTVLHRLRQVADTKVDKQKLAAKIHEIFDEIAAFSSGFRDTETTDFPRIPHMGSIYQSRNFNLLELAAYFLNLPYDHLEGISSTNDLFPGYEHWMLVGLKRQIASVKYHEAVILEELNSKERSHPQALLFRLGKEDRDCSWKPPRQGWAKPPHPTAIHLLALLLSDEVSDIHDLKRRMFRSDDAFRQAKSRLAKMIADSFHVKPAKVFDEDLNTGLPLLAPQIVLYGAVYVPRLRRNSESI